MASGTIPASGIKLLWDNPNPSQTFATQQISVAAGYYFYIIEFRITTQSTATIHWVVTRSNSVAEYIHSPNTSVYATICSRTCDASTGGKIIFGDCQTRMTNSTTRSADNTYMIPHKIYGIASA